MNAWLRSPIAGRWGAAHAPDEVDLHPQVLAHYRIAAPLIEANFGGAPIVYANFPDGFEPHREHVHLTDLPLTAANLLSLVERAYAMEFYSWVPLPTDHDRLRFGRMVLTRPLHDEFIIIREAAECLRDVLRTAGLDAVPVQDGHNGLALWIPFADAPPSASVRAFLEDVCAQGNAVVPGLFYTEPNFCGDYSVNVDLSSNAPRGYNILPYSLRGVDNLKIATPVTWDEVRSMRLAICARDFPDYLAQRGDVFARELTRIGLQHLPESQQRR
jgi:DNA primase